MRSRSGAGDGLGMRLDRLMWFGSSVLFDACYSYCFLLEFD